MPSSLSLSSFGVIVAAVAAVAIVVIFIDVVLVAPATIALAAFIVALAVVTTMFLAIDVGLIFDCCICRCLSPFGIIGRCHRRCRRPHSPCHCHPCCLRCRPRCCHHHVPHR